MIQHKFQLIPLSLCAMILFNLHSYIYKYKVSALPQAQGFGLVSPDPLPLWVGSGQETTQHLPVAETSTSYNNKYHQQKSPPELSVSDINKSRHTKMAAVRRSKQHPTLLCPPVVQRAVLQ